MVLSRFVAGWLVLSAGLVPGGNASPGDPNSILRDAAHTLLCRQLAGQWTAEAGTSTISLSFAADGAFRYGTQTGTYRLVDEEHVELQTASARVVYRCEISPNRLVLSEGDLTAPLALQRRSLTRGLSEDLDRWSPRRLGRLGRLVWVLVVMVACRLVLVGLQWLMRFLIYSEWGPLKFLYRQHKARTLTLTTIALNASKYVVYLIGLGVMLSILGINYAAYLASLSVVGLAIGFGSQGLVQDMVTGLFIIFENQFDVGDTVELAGFVGRVEALGLRMTRLRTALGQQVIIPNRNIGMVVNYERGVLRAQVDLPLGTNEDAEVLADQVLAAVRDIQAQFAHALSSPVERPRVLQGPGQRRWLRLTLALWPTEKWVIEQRLLPRLKSLSRHATDEGLGEPVAFYGSAPD